MPLKVLGGTRSSAKSRAFGPGGNTATNTKPLFNMNVKSLVAKNSVTASSGIVNKQLTTIRLDPKQFAPYEESLVDFGNDAMNVNTVFTAGKDDRGYQSGTKFTVNIEDGDDFDVFVRTV